MELKKIFRAKTTCNNVLGDFLSKHYSYDFTVARLFTVFVRNCYPYFVTCILWLTYPSVSSFTSCSIWYRNIFIVISFLRAKILDYFSRGRWPWRPWNWATTANPFAMAMFIKDLWLLDQRAAKWHTRLTTNVFPRFYDSSFFNQSCTKTAEGVRFIFFYKYTKMITIYIHKHSTMYC